jgi:hypothetical protein
MIENCMLIFVFVMIYILKIKQTKTSLPVLGFNSELSTVMIKVITAGS